MQECFVVHKMPFCKKNSSGSNEIGVEEHKK
jgi:hypothetical protein